MKTPSLLFPGLAAALIALPLSLSAQSVTTDPVGVINVDLPGNSDTVVSVPFHRPVEFQGSVDSIDGNQITVNGTPGWSTNQFVYDAPGQTDTFYVLFASGEKEGMFYTIDANTADTLTLDLAGDTLAGVQSDQDDGPGMGDILKIIPYWTLGTLFGDNNDDIQGIVPSPNVLNPLAFVNFRDPNQAGINLSFSGAFFYHDGAQGPMGWYKAGSIQDGVQNDHVITPDTFFTIRITQSGESSMALTGAVPMVNMSSVVNIIESNRGQDNFIAYPYPVGATLGESGLIQSGSFKASPNVLNPLDTVSFYNNESTALNKSFASTYFYHDGSQGPEGWYRAGSIQDGLQNDTEVFIPGTGFVIRKAAGDAESRFWVFPANYLE